MLENVMTYVTLIAPSMVAILAEIIALLMIVYKTTKAIKEIHGSNDVKLLKDEIKVLIEDNAELRKTEKTLIEEIRRIKNGRE